jgi:virulence-associated protein VagC
MGWRYFGRVHPPESEEELFSVDHVVDAEWGLVRYRQLHQSGARIVATPATGGIEVVTGRPGDERAETVAGASAVWSSSPCSLLVVDRLLRATGRTDVAAVRIGVELEPDAITVRLERQGSRLVATPGGDSEAEVVGVTVDGEAFEALIRSDLPLFAPGWFDLAA